MAVEHGRRARCGEGQAVPLCQMTIDQAVQPVPGAVSGRVRLLVWTAPDGNDVPE